MRNISLAGLAKLAQTHGNEPIILLEVDWTPSAQPKWYGDRTVDDIPGKILEVGSLDNIIGITSNDTSQELSIVLDDTDGSLKTIFDGTDIHKRTARVYQWFEGLDLSDKFLLFSGKVSTPIVWDERDRTVRFTILSQIEDKEVGFSPEEGQFEWLPAAMVGQPWPVIFGTVLDCPALRINEAINGTTLCGVGEIAGSSYLSSMPLFNNGADSDTSVAPGLAQIARQQDTIWCAMSAYSGYDDGKSAELLDQYNALSEQSAQMVAGANQRSSCAGSERSKQAQDVAQSGYGCNPLKILGGEDFPQGETLTLEINGCFFTGYFDEQDFHISTRNWPDGEAEAASQHADRQEGCAPVSQSPGWAEFDYRIPVPCGRGDQYFGDNCLCRSYGYIVQTASGRSSKVSDDPIPQQFWAEPGATVRISSDEPITYIVSVIPGTVLTVKAYKDFPGQRRLVDIPSDYYTVETVTYGTLQVVQIVTLKPLSSYKDQGWTDDLYVTFESSVGPDTIDILVYLIEHYTDLTYDSVSFEAVRTKLTPFPVNFPVLERKNTVEVLQDIAFQARCALWLSNGKFYIQYLPEEPSSVDIITESDIDAEEGIQIELTTTEDLVTKMCILWRMSWSPGITNREKDKSEKTIILRHNVNRYGVQEEEYDWYIYNQPDIIYKCATFWLIRKSNTWKRVKFSTFLHKLNLETFDCVTLNFFDPYVADGAVKAIVEKATYNSDTNRIEFQCLVPVKAGQMTKYDWFWPAGLSFHLTWPPPDEIAAGDAGGDGEGMSAGGSLPIGYFEDWGDDIVIVGGPNVVFRPQSDWGDRHPTDVDFTAQTVMNSNYYDGITFLGSKPRLNLRTFMAQPTNPPAIADLQSGLVIDIRKTHIIDTRDASSRYAKFSSVFKNINNAGKLTLRKDVLIADNSHPDGEIFDFKWSDEYELWAAGTAFLRDD